MKHALMISLACFVACTFVSFNAFSAGGPKPEPLPKAKTIAELIVSVVIWYVPFGEFDGNEVIFFEEEKKLDLKTEWIWR